ncbi:hypothetical protein [Mesorhizobium sp. M1B.F.Ca.ET.045.04.1.1]|uniref:hypothetical protein n=1 Tax=Mesorhizobium sp. M1B.F.Ca.ET.045.04.1.1 TaxID=2493673 RepID=UPI000F74F2AD|nr:hypothetical protein [Mesorhizobium sp. M1B.F.Ca.ET.045.04.1.1]AZO32458.1 hypothetical protein EJ071_37375 [Mesorhizobium sp. M1B.F.Ca.ET.045.04.1.1]
MIIAKPIEVRWNASNSISQLTTKPNRSPARVASVALDKEEAYGLPINRIECQAGPEGTPPSSAEETGGPSSDNAPA